MSVREPLFTFLKGLLLLEGGPQTFIITTPFYVENDDAMHRHPHAANTGGQHARAVSQRAPSPATG